MRWVRCPQNILQYQQFKVQSRKIADGASEAWWGAKVEEEEGLHEEAVMLGRDGSLFRREVVRLVQRGQREQPCQQRMVPYTTKF